MCFSAEASFTLGAVLTATGAACLWKAKNSKLIWIALLPLIFGMQQFTEGLVWLHLKGSLDFPWTLKVAQTLFLTVSLIVWPIYIPMAVYAAETIRWKKMACLALFLVGLVISCLDLVYLLTETVNPVIKGNSIYYPASPYYGNVFYGCATILPFFISSIKNLWIFGLFLLVTFIITEVISHYTFTSVWCFFAAAASLILLKIINSEADQA